MPGDNRLAVFVGFSAAGHLLQKVICTLAFLICGMCSSRVRFIEKENYFGTPPNSYARIRNVSLGRHRLQQESGRTATTATTDSNG
jgi:hypothetical protein